MIVALAAGGPTDVFARLIAQKLSDSTGKQFYVENIPGAGGNIGIGPSRAGGARRLYDPRRGQQLRRQSEPLPLRRPIIGYNGAQQQAFSCLRKAEIAPATRRTGKKKSMGLPPGETSAVQGAPRTAEHDREPSLEHLGARI
jgi:hypothetical protein